MNKEAQQQLDAILAKDISSLTQVDLDFLTARKAYLTEEQLSNYFPTKAEETPAPKKKTKVSTPNLD